MPRTADPNDVRKLTALNGYLELLLNEFAAPEGEDEQEDELILILVCMQKSLERRINQTRPTLEWVQCMKWSVVEANKLLDKIYDVSNAHYEFVADWNPTERPKNVQQNLAAWLMVIQHELHTDIAQGEEFLKHELESASREFAAQMWTEYEAGAALE
jgi:hypothetical protein